MRPYTQLDQQLHLLSQSIAKVGRSFVPERDDDGHTSLYYDALGKRLMGHWFNTPNGKYILALHLTNSCFEWLDPMLRTVTTLPIAGRTAAEIETSLAAQIIDFGLAPQSFLSPLHYTIPKYDLQEQAFQRFSAEAVASWHFWRSLANRMLFRLIGHLQCSEAVRIWPHHFDTGAFLPLAEYQISFGWAPEDAAIGCPYFYFRVYRGSDEVPYEAPPELTHGFWQTDRQPCGALLPMTQINALPPLQIEAAVTDYLYQSLQWIK